MIAQARSCLDIGVKLQVREDAGTVMIVILCMTNLSAPVRGLIAMCICVYIIIVDLRGRDRPCA